MPSKEAPTQHERLTEISVFPPRGRCLFIEGEASPLSAIRFCAEPVSEVDGSWCDKHKARVFTAGAARAAAERAIESAAKRSAAGER